MPQGGGEHDFWPLGVEIVPGSKTPYLIDRNLLIDFHKVLYRTLVTRNPSWENQRLLHEEGEFICCDSVSEPAFKTHRYKL